MRDFLTEYANRMADAGASAMPRNYKRLVRAGRAHLREAAAFDREAVTGFALDLETGVLTLDMGRAEVRVEAQVVGTWSDEGSFMWGWGHPSVPAPLQQAAWAAQRFGERQGIEELLTRGGDTREAQVAEFCAITAYLANADGVFIGDHGGGGKVCCVWFGAADAGNKQP